MKAIQIYKHILRNNVFGVADKIKEQRKNPNKRKYVKKHR